MPFYQIYFTDRLHKWCFLMETDNYSLAMRFKSFGYRVFRTENFNGTD